MKLKHIGLTVTACAALIRAAVAHHAGQVSIPS